jgi:signal transduction histidine kinase
MRAKVLSLRLAGLVFAWLAAVAVVVWLVLSGRMAALERGERATAAFAAVVEQQAARTFQAVYLTLGAVADAQQLSRPAKNDPEFQRMMRRRLQAVPFARALFVVGPDGWIVHDTDYPKTPRVSLADRPYFTAYASSHMQAETAWPPVFSRSGTGWFVPVTRPLGNARRFEGVVVAALQAEHFRQDFRRIGLEEGYVISLLHADGTLIASYPGKGTEVGRSYLELPLFAGPLAARSGTFWTGHGLLPGERVASYRRLEAAPVVVRVSRSKDDVLAEWRRTATGAAVAMLALTIFLGWFIARLARESAQRNREREQRMQAEKMEALGQLTSGLAHDLGNMLYLMSLHVATVRRVGTPETAPATTAMERALEAGRETVDRLLAFARRREVRPVRLQLGEALEAARPLLTPAGGSRVTLHIFAEGALPGVLCDPGELDTALLNLVVNARDAMAGSGRIEVRAFADRRGRRVCVSVADDGPGMTEAVRRRVLEPFFTTKGEAGTGLGLSQVYGFVQQAGGEMTVESAPGRGTTVTLCFPEARGSG